MKQSVVGRRDSSAQTRLGRLLGFLIEKQICVLQQILRERRSHPTRIPEVGAIGGEIENRIEVPTIIRLKLVKEHRRHSSLHGRAGRAPIHDRAVVERNNKIVVR